MRKVFLLTFFCPAFFAQQVQTGAEVYGPVTPYFFDGDIRALPLAGVWRPGDPIKEVPRLRDGVSLPNFKPIPPQIDPLLQRQQRVTTIENPLAFGDQSFEGQGFSGVNPPDTDGDVGPNYFIQAINGSGGATFVVYNKSDGSVAAGPIAMDSLGSGNCASGFGDPIVLYDELAQRWLLSEFSNSGNRMCIYVSQTSDPITGGWFHYSFQGVQFPDYPHYGVWSDAYYVGTNENGRACYALERAQMLAGNPAQMQRFVAPDLPGFTFNALTPADLDGSTPPPVGAPGIFMGHRDDEVHNAGSNNPTEDYLDMYFFHVDWANSANSTFTGPVSIAMSEIDSSLCGLTAFNCFPQPGSGTTLDPLREVIMFRLAYRNGMPHQVLTGSLVTDVNGADLGGVRWFELRDTAGTWNLFQEGTYSPDSTNRWMSSIAMDASGNIGLAYNVTDSSMTFPGLRYAGRLAGHPSGTLPIAETSIVEGSAANGSNRYGDYAQLNVDPVTGSTFWFTGEYNPASSWSTRIGSFSFCIPPDPPTGLSATPNGDNQIDLAWSSSAGADSYKIYRAQGSCPGSVYTLLASGVTGTSYSDTTVSGGINYAYSVHAFSSSASCESGDSNCDDALATGDCLIPPSFEGLVVAQNAQQNMCAIDLSWNAGSPTCSGTTLHYNIYRSTTGGFTPGPGNLLESCVIGTTYQDQNVDSGQIYFYIVRAEDDSSLGAGPCNTGIEELNIVELSATATGPDQISFEDNLESGDSNFTVAVGPGQTGGAPEWVLVETTSQSPSHSFFVPNQSSLRDQLLITASPIAISAVPGTSLEFWQRVITETNFDGTVLEWSIDGGSDWFDILAAGDGIPANTGRILETPYHSTLNGSGPLGGRLAWHGNHPSFEKVKIDLADFAGENLLLRWRFGSDGSVNQTGYWMDDVVIFAPTDCNSTCILADQFASWPDSANILDLISCFNLGP